MERIRWSGLHQLGGLLLGCALVLASTPALAGGLYVSEFATPDLGTATAGALARGADAATSLTNTAAMTRLDDHELLLGFAPGFMVLEFDPDPATPSTGGYGGDQAGFLPILTGGYVHKLSDRVRLGIGLTSVAGAFLDPRDSWTGRFEMTELTLATLTTLLSASVRVTDWLSIGAGASMTYAHLDWTLRFTRPGPGGAEQNFKIDDADDFAAAANVSVLVEPIDNVRIGLVYQSETKLELDGHASTSLPPTFMPQLVAKLPLAMFLRTDVFWQLNDRVALMGGAGWENWSAADVVPVSVGSSGSAVLPLGFKDTWMVRAGIHYRLNDELRLQTGFRYDSSALDTKDRIAALPVDRQWRLGVGAIWDWTESRQVGFSFQWADLGDARLENPTVIGDYKSNDIFLWNININWSKLPWSGKAMF